MTVGPLRGVVYIRPTIEVQEQIPENHHKDFESEVTCVFNFDTEGTISGYRILTKIGE
jgi:hypothetical protein